MNWEVYDSVSLHPKTVENAHVHVARERKSPKGRNKVDVIQVDIRVWKQALEIAGNDVTRLVVVSETEVIVLNQSKRKRRV